MPSSHILVIDDELALRQILTDAVAKAGFSVDQAATFSEASSKLARDNVDIALCDIKLPDGSGIDLLRSTRSAGLETAFIMVTAFASLETAVEALRAGAIDYMVKPVRNEELVHRLSRIEQVRGLRAENTLLRRVVEESTPKRYSFKCPQMQEVDRLVRKVAATNSTVLITGESGTGKGILAREIHERSQRNEMPFVAVNCSAIPEQLLESEFFGHVKGSFTGADRTRRGLFLEADKGTLFLDEIGELPLSMQTKLLNVIEEKEVRPVGGEQARHVDTRIIAATNGDLRERVAAGEFREDLFFRISMFQIHMPPLRERQSDLPALVRFILRGKRSERGNAEEIGIDRAAEEVLLAHSWPGNVRELENVITRASILAEDNVITVDDLPGDIIRRASRADGNAAGEELGFLREQLRRMEAEIVRRAISEAKGDRRLAAQKLGIGLSSLYRKLDELGVVDSESPTKSA